MRSGGAHSSEELLQEPPPPRALGDDGHKVSVVQPAALQRRQREHGEDEERRDDRQPVQVVERGVPLVGVRAEPQLDLPQDLVQRPAYESPASGALTAEQLDDERPRADGAHTEQHDVRRPGVLGVRRQPPEQGRRQNEVAEPTPSVDRAAAEGAEVGPVEGAAARDAAQEAARPISGMGEEDEGDGEDEGGAGGDADASEAKERGELGGSAGGERGEVRAEAAAKTRRERGRRSMLSSIDFGRRVAAGMSSGPRKPPTSPCRPTWHVRLVFGAVDPRAPLEEQGRPRARRRAG